MKIKEIGYEYEASLNRELWQECKDLSTDSPFLNGLALRSGRDALKAVAREYQPTVAFLPSLACDSMVLPFKLLNHQVTFYKLNDDFSINREYLEKLLEEHKDKEHVLFLYMNYFGNECLSNDSLNELKSRYPNIIFINDITQTLLSNAKESFEPDYVLASLRKWLAVPDGGILWANKELINKSFTSDNKFSNQRLSAQNMREEFLNSGDESLKGQFRKIFSSVSDIIDEEKEIAKMSEYSYRLAKQTDLLKVNQRRSDNAVVLINELKGHVRFIQDNVNKSNLYVGILIENRDYIQKELAKQGIFATIIWPLCDEQKHICEFAKYVEEHMLAIYCDQRYDGDDMKYVAKEIKRLIDE